MAVKTNDLVCFNCSSKNGGKGGGIRIMGYFKHVACTGHTLLQSWYHYKVLFSMLSCLARPQKILGAADQGL